MNEGVGWLMDTSDPASVRVEGVCSLPIVLLVFFTNLVKMLLDILPDGGPVVGGVWACGAWPGSAPLL